MAMLVDRQGVRVLARQVLVQQVLVQQVLVRRYGVNLHSDAPPLSEEALAELTGKPAGVLLRHR